MKLGKLKIVPNIRREEVHEKCLAFFRWVNHRLGEIPPSVRQAVINLDETAISYAYNSQRGFIVKRRQPTSMQQRPVEVEDKENNRGTITYVSLICSDDSLQALVPQFLIGIGLSW
jgi:hypothetical protein